MPLGPRRAAWAASVLFAIVGAGACKAKAPSGVDARRQIANPQWRLYAVEYARSSQVKIRRLVRGGPPGAVDMSWYFYVAVGHGRVVLVDAGTDEFVRRPEGARRKSWAIERARSVPDALALIGLAPSHVTDVIVTHRHWDHVDGIVHFPRARVHAHPGEWSSMGKRLRKATARIEAEGRFVPVAGTPATPVQGITIREAGRHTAHHCTVSVKCARSTFVIGGDGAYLFDNLAKRLPITQTKDPEGNQRDMAELGGVGVVLPGHDPKLFVRYPGPPGVAVLCR